MTTFGAGLASQRGALARRYREFVLIARDPVLFMSLLVTGIFLAIFVVFPLSKAMVRGFFDKGGAFSVEYFARYFDSYFGPYSREVFTNTLVMGVLTATGGTLLGFVFAYTMVRCSPPGARWVHILALVPTVSPPFAIAMSTILLFGRNGLITRRVLGLSFPQGANDIYGMDGIVFVQVITYFSVAYLIIRAMLERLDPSMEEAAHSLGASKWHIFRTVTLPLLIPGLAGSFLLLFVESLADLGNPLLISGNVTVLSAQIFLAVAGEYDYQKASTLALVLLIPTLVVFLVQRYWVSRRSYISVTGKPTGGQILVKEPVTRWIFVSLTYLVTALIIVLYVSIVVGSFSRVWGRDFTLTLDHWRMMLGRGIEAILDTTLLSLLATPVAGLLGMVIAFMVVRKVFSGKEMLDFGSNLGAAVPGTILGIGFVLTFNTPPTVVVILLYAVLALFLVRMVVPGLREQLIVLAVGTGLAIGLRLLESVLGEIVNLYVIGGAYVAVGAVCQGFQRLRRSGWVLAGMGGYLFLGHLSTFLAQPIAAFSLGLQSDTAANAVYQFADYVKVFFQVPPPILAMVYLFAAVLLVRRTAGTFRIALTAVLLALGGALCFSGQPLALVGTPYIIIAAYAVRSLPASVRAGVAALQQIDPAIDEASNSLGADAQYTFRKVTLPLIAPALLAGLIFSFTRHMTSLSAIIFLVSSRWRIVTASILSEWEQGGISFAAAYSSVIILLVLVAIGVLYYVTTRVFEGRGEIDLSLGA
jgi:iron(III) transport system permease protein